MEGKGRKKVVIEEGTRGEGREKGKKCRKRKGRKEKDIKGKERS